MTSRRTSTRTTRGLAQAAVAATVFAVLTTSTSTPAAPPDVRVLRAETAAPSLLGPGATIADGAVTALLRHGDRVLVRSEATEIGTFGGSSVLLDGASLADPQRTFSDGQVSVSQSDGAGGWYVAGDFTQVDGVVRQSVAHLLADGTLDPAFRITAGGGQAVGLVDAITVVDDTVYLGGFFTSVNGRSRKGLAAVDAATGELRDLSAPQGKPVTEIAYAPATSGHGPRLLVSTGRLMALDPVTGARIAGFAPAVSGGIAALAVVGDRVYVGGDGVVALDAGTGDLDPAFSAVAPGYRGQVRVLQLDGDRLYAGGPFNRLGGVTGPLVALDPATGTADPGFTTTLRAGGQSAVNDVAVAGDALVVGGFALGSAADRGLVVLAAADGAVRESAPRTYDVVNAVEASAGRVLVGGAFYLESRSPLARFGFSALDADTLTPVATYPGIGRSSAAMIPGNDVVYLAEDHFSGYTEGRHAFPVGTGNVTAFDPDTGSVVPRLSVRQVVGLTGVTAFDGRLYVARRLGRDARYPRVRIDVYSQRTGARVDRFLLPRRGYVTTLTHVRGRLLAAGSFRHTRGDGTPAHSAILQVDPRTGRLFGGFDPQLDVPCTTW